MMTARLTHVLATTMVAALWLAPEAGAQTNDEIFPQLQWNFSTPGARANAMGGAFIGLADDATAAVTNPAGLVALNRPQSYFEFKHTEVKVNRFASIDSLDLRQTRAFTTTVDSPSFFSFSVPIGQNVAVGFTRHEFLNHRETFSLDARPIPETDVAFFPVQGNADFRGVSYAGTISASVNKMLRLGMTVSFNQLDASATATRFDFIAGAERYDLATSNIVVHQTSIARTDNDTGVTIGALFRPADVFAVGVVYAKQPRFTISETLQGNSDYVDNSPTLSTNGPLETAPGFPKPVSMNVPDRVAVGVAVRPHSRLTVVSDVVYIGYSSLAENVTLVFPIDGATAENYTIKNTTEAHVGAELLLVGSVFARGGLYTNPDHSVRFVPGTDEATNAGETAINNLASRDTQVKGTFGGGFAIGRYFQADLAYIWKKELVASAAFRF